MGCSRHQTTPLLVTREHCIKLFLLLLLVHSTDFCHTPPDSVHHTFMNAFEGTISLESVIGRKNSDSESELTLAVVCTGEIRPSFVCDRS